MNPAVHTVLILSVVVHRVILNGYDGCLPLSGSDNA